MENSAANRRSLIPRRFHRGSTVNASLPLIIIVLSIFLLLGVVPGNVSVAWISSGFTDPFPSGDATGQSSIVEGRFGYLWGFNEIWLRDGDNSLIAPAKKEVTLNSLAFGLYGETFLLSDLTARVQAWINVPNESGNDFLFDVVRERGIPGHATWELICRSPIFSGSEDRRTGPALLPDIGTTTLIIVHTSSASRRDHSTTTFRFTFPTSASPTRTAISWDLSFGWTSLHPG